MKRFKKWYNIPLDIFRHLFYYLENAKEHLQFPKTLTLYHSNVSMHSSGRKLLKLADKKKEENISRIAGICKERII